MRAIAVGQCREVKFRSEGAGFGLTQVVYLYHIDLSPWAFDHTFFTNS